MTTKTYRTKSGRTLHRPIMTEDEYAAADYGLEDNGFCLGCGSDAYGVEPDARRYTCESCDEKLVYGLQELLLMGILRIAAVA